jgi:hypothetical protein
MNNSKIRVLALFGLIATVGSTSAMAQPRIPFTVPFGFTVGAKAFAAGEYNVQEVASNIVLIQSLDGHGAMITMCRPGDGKKTDKPVLLFHQYGNRYFLSEFRYSGRGSALPISAGEKELLAGRESPKTQDVVASVRK